jgi:hypothetical protein
MRAKTGTCFTTVAPVKKDRLKEVLSDVSQRWPMKVQTFLDVIF